MIKFLSDFWDKKYKCCEERKREGKTCEGCPYLWTGNTYCDKAKEKGFIKLEDIK